MTRYWKVLDANGQSCHGGSFRWSLPRWDAKRGWIPGEWTPAITNIEPCARGYHLCRDKDLVHSLNARIYACEVRGRIIEADGKVVVESVRLTCPTPWDDCAARLFAVECGAEVLPLYERRYPNDSRCADALEVAFRHAIGDATDAELAAAWDAARAAASATAWDAARAAASAAASATAWDAAWDAASATASAAAWDAASATASAAAWDAAWDAASAAARGRQTDRLLTWLNAEHGRDGE